MREDGWSGMWLDLVERQKVKGARRAIYNCNGWMKCTQMSRRHLGGSKLTTFRHVSNFARHSDGAQGIGWPPGRQSMEYVFCSRRLK